MGWDSRPPDPLAPGHHSAGHDAHEREHTPGLHQTAPMFYPAPAPPLPPKESP